MMLNKKLSVEPLLISEGRQYRYITVLVPGTNTHNKKILKSFFSQTTLFSTANLILYSWIPAVQSFTLCIEEKKLHSRLFCFVFTGTKHLNKMN